MMARDPGAAPQRFQSAAARSELIDGMVRFELLAQAAERAGLMQNPDAIHAAALALKTPGEVRGPLPP
jgi:hypothetical protein